jgi:hypothetical protein
MDGCGYTPYLDPNCPGSLLLVQANLWSVAWGQRLLPQIAQTINVLTNWKKFGLRHSKH